MTHPHANLKSNYPLSGFYLCLLLLFGNILFFYFTLITSALLTEVLAVLQISMLCAIFWEYFISLEWSKVIALHIPTAVAAANSKAVITLEHLSILLFAFMVFTFLFCLFFVFPFWQCKVRHHIFSFQPFTSFWFLFWCDSRPIL